MTRGTLGDNAFRAEDATAICRARCGAAAGDRTHAGRLSLLRRLPAAFQGGCEFARLTRTEALGGRRRRCGSGKVSTAPRRKCIARRGRSSCLGERVTGLSRSRCRGESPSIQLDASASGLSPRMT